MKHLGKKIWEPVNWQFHKKPWEANILSYLLVDRALINEYMAAPSFARIIASRFSSSTFLLFCTPLKIFSASFNMDLVLVIWSLMEFCGRPATPDTIWDSFGLKDKKARMLICKTY